MDNAHAAAGARDSELAFLVMVPTSETLSSTASESKTMLAAVRKQLMRPDVKGIDVAGPEAKPFTEQGKQWLRSVIELAREVAHAKGSPIVVRPHVGEGYAAGTPDHAEIGRNNLDMALDALEEAGYTGPGDVIVRFGHASHAGPAQLRRMQKLGIIAEALLGSNLATETFARGEEHPLLANMYYGVSTVLATDGQGVMRNSLPIEFQRAGTLIEQFKLGHITLELDGKKIQWRSLDSTQQKRFSIQWLVDQAESYRKAAAAPISNKEP
jgi:hypothetical protein